MAYYQFHPNHVWRLIRLDDHWLWGIVDLNNNTPTDFVQALIPLRFNHRARALFEQHEASIAAVVNVQPDAVREPRRFGPAHRTLGWAPTHASPKRDWPRPAHTPLQQVRIEAHEAFEATARAMMESAQFKQFWKSLMIPADRW